jgi:hypothetical protein
MNAPSFAARRLHGWIILALLGMAIALPAHAVDPGLYDRATLDHWGQRYRVSTQKILDQVIRPALLTGERRKLENVRLDLPLHAEGSQRGRPLAFYADGFRVVMPVYSLKFLDDLCTAYAWLQINGYSLETISDYTAMLRYGKVRPTPAFAPLTALGVPANALDDKRVDDLALGHFVTARTFILLHELGHVFHGHRGGSGARSRMNEEEADRFAAEAMARTPLPPLGSLVFFMADASWAGYPAAETDTHPLSGARLRTLAGRVEDRGLAQGLRHLAELMDDADIRTGFAAAGKSATLASLKPRRPGELPGAAQQHLNGAFSGSYAGQATQHGDPAFPVHIEFQRQGERVHGSYSFGVGIGSLMGQVDGRRLDFDWQWAGNYGRGAFQASRDGKTFNGTWGYRQSADNAGKWNGKRVTVE